MITHSKQLSEEEFEFVNNLWNSEYPVQLNNRLSLLLEDCSAQDHYFFKNEESEKVAWLVVFEKENEKRFSILVSNKIARKGVGTELMKVLKNNHSNVYGWVINHNEDVKIDGSKYISPLPFYEKIGCEILFNDKLETDLIKAVKIKI